MAQESQSTETDPLLGQDTTLPEPELASKPLSWEGKEDPENPRCFPPKRKRLIVFILISIAILSYIPIQDKLTS
jgi:hypothetical protein